MISLWLIFGFFIIAALYASVGFGGGSSYLALLSTTSLPFWVLPILGLSCNLVVVSLGYHNFGKALGWLFRKPSFKAVAILLVPAPFALLGGYIQLSPESFYLWLGSGLILASLSMCLQLVIDYRASKIAIPFQQPGLSANPVDPVHNTDWSNSQWFGLLYFAIPIALFSGMVGIGGGIFLAPVLYLFRWGNAKLIAYVASISIFINSLTALIGHLLRLQPNQVLYLEKDIGASAFYLLAVVGIAGMLGSYLGAFKYSQTLIKSATCLLIFTAGTRVLLAALNIS